MPFHHLPCLGLDREHGGRGRIVHEDHRVVESARGLGDQAPFRRGEVPVPQPLQVHLSLGADETFQNLLLGHL